MSWDIFGTEREELRKQISSLEKDREQYVKQLREWENKYNALWDLKNKIVNENLTYRNNLQNSNNRLADVNSQLQNLRSMYNKLVDDNAQLRLVKEKQEDIFKLQNELIETKKNNRLQKDKINRLELKAEITQGLLKTAKEDLSSALNNNEQLLKENQATEQIKDRIDYISLLPFAQIPNDFKDSILTGRLATAFNATDLSIEDKINISAKIRSGDHFYNTNLFGCDCPDFKGRHAPCKHMLFLSYTSGLMLLNKEALSSFTKSNIFKLNMKIEQEKEEATNAKNQNQILQRRKREMLQISDRLTHELDQSYPWLAGMYKRFQIEQDNHEAYLLSPRSTTSKDIVKKLKKKNAELRYEKALCENQLLVYESLFPWLEEFKKVDVNKAVEYVRDTQTDEEYDKISDYLSPAEYKTLSSAQKSQLALERYKKHRKSDWEIGIDYERYIGYKYETVGYNVSYTGATDALKDMGRDLICEKDGKILVIQCKRWSIHKTIHEKHIFQLFGSTMQFKHKNPDLIYEPVFYTTTKLSEVAAYCAEQLNVKVFEQEKYVDYPCIKCNISKNGDKIYHLPFDQQYDRISIETGKGEFYAMTAQEAENAGFRRAFRHFG